MKCESFYTQTESRRICLFLLNLSAVIGIMAGAVLAVTTDNGVNMWLHQYFSPSFSGNTVFEVFRNTLFTSVFFLAGVFLLGLSAVGQPFGIALMVYRGVGIGFSAALMYIDEGFGAFTDVLVFIVPKAAAVIFLMSLAVREMLRQSGSLMTYMLHPDKSESRRTSGFRLYCIKFAVIALILLIVSVLDSALNYFFMDLV